MVLGEQEGDDAVLAAAARSRAGAKPSQIADVGKWVVTKASWLGQKVFIDVPMIVVIKSMDFFRLLLTGARPHCLASFCAQFAFFNEKKVYRWLQTPWR